MTSILLFIVFSKWNPGNIKWINYISPATFGVYLIHDNVVMRPFFGKICKKMQLILIQMKFIYTQFYQLLWYMFVAPPLI